MARAFIFSIDASVAFTLSLLAIYSLIFFSAIPSAYYSTLTQAHYLAKDSLSTLAFTSCTDDLCDGDVGEGVSLLDYIVITLDGYPNDQWEKTKEFLGPLIPDQFGYRLEVEEGSSWQTLYDTATDDESDNEHLKVGNRLSVSSYALVFGIEGIAATENPYGYNTCNGVEIPCTVPSVIEGYPKAEVSVVKLTVYA